MRFRLNGMIASDEDAPILRWWGWPAVCPADIRQALEGNPEGEEFVLEINSGGGQVYAGFEMYSVIRMATVPTRAEVQSMAGSAASVVLSAADTAAATPVGQVMIHLPSTITWGNQLAHHQTIDMLESVTASILAGYEARCKGKTTRTELRRLMDKESYLTAQEALQIGLLDEIIGADAAEPLRPENVFNAAGGLPDMDKLRAAYMEAQGKGKPSLSKLDKEAMDTQAVMRFVNLEKARYGGIYL